MHADQLIELLGLQPHPEGGWYAETWRAPVVENERTTSTAIYFLLKAGETSHWHTVDADEVWVHHLGSALELSMVRDGTTHREMLGPDLEEGERPQLVVPAGTWQSARPNGEWALVSCVVAPGFDFAGFVLAPPGWEPRDS
ncbi:MAG: cupin domain-containing protein [Acidimicrobiales bacterium]